MKNFANSSGNKKLWGVLGKQKEYYSPSHFQKEKTPLNASPLEAWDYKKSKYKRVDLVPRQMENDGQQGGVVPQVSSTPVPAVSPTPTPSLTPTLTPTPSFTPTQTQTLTPTPSSTPYILPETPALWYDATNLGSIDFITSGGTDYVSAWRSIGTYQKTLTGATVSSMPQWSGSSQMPGSPRIVRFTKSTVAADRDCLNQRFDSTLIPQSGLTIFYVMANPNLDYTGIGNVNGFGCNFVFYSGNTITGGFNGIAPLLTTAPVSYANNIMGASNAVQLPYASNGINFANNFANFSATSLNNKFLFTAAYPYPTGNPYFELNQSGGTLATTITASTLTGINAINMGNTVSSGGTIGISNAGMELGELMVFNRTLSPSEQDQVQLYLRDKWRYDEWNSPLPVPTPTPSRP